MSVKLPCPRSVFWKDHGPSLLPSRAVTCSEPTLQRRPLLLWCGRKSRKDTKGKQVLILKPLLRSWQSPGRLAGLQTLLILGEHPDPASAHHCTQGGVSCPGLGLSPLSPQLLCFWLGWWDGTKQAAVTYHLCCLFLSLCNCEVALDCILTLAENIF